MKPLTWHLMPIGLAGALLVGLACNSSSKNPVDGDATPDLGGDDPSSVAEDGGLDPQFAKGGGGGTSTTSSGSKKLKGSSSSPGGSVNPPYSRSVSASAGNVVLVQTSAVAIPVNTNNAPLARYLSNVASYGSLPVPTNGVSVNVPFYMSQAQTFELKMYNSATETGPLYPEAANWTWSMSAIPLQDTGEPNDDENVSTTSDRTSGAVLALGTQLNRSMYSRIGVVDKDLEEWYAFDLAGGSTYRFTLGTSSNTWGSWGYSLRLYSSAGVLVGSSLNYTGLSLNVDWAAPSAGRYYLQIEGLPISTRGASMYFAQYSIKGALLSGPCLAPDVTSAGSGSTMNPGLSATFTASVGGGTPTGWSWNFGGGATPNTSTASSPVVTLGAVGTYNGSVVVSNSCGSENFPFSYSVSNPSGGGGTKWVGLDLKVFRSSSGANPALWYGLASWSVTDVRNWFTTHVNPVWLPSGVQVDPSRINVTFVTDHPEWYVLDSDSEFQACRTYVQGSDRVMKLGAVDDQTYSSWAGIAWASSCTQSNTGRGMLVLSMNTSFMVNAVAHEMGHVMDLPHIRTVTSPLTTANYNLMSYGTTNKSLSSNITREATTGCWLTQDNPMNQLAVSNAWIGANIDWM